MAHRSIAHLAVKDDPSWDAHRIIAVGFGVQATLRNMTAMAGLASRPGGSRGGGGVYNQGSLELANWAHGGGDFTRCGMSASPGVIGISRTIELGIRRLCIERSIVMSA